MFLCEYFTPRCYAIFACLFVGQNDTTISPAAVRADKKSHINIMYIQTKFKRHCEDDAKVAKIYLRLSYVGFLCVNIYSAYIILVTIYFAPFACKRG